MVDFPRTIPTGTTPISPYKPANRRTVAPDATLKREMATIDRRRMKDRRSRRNKQIMDRRTGADRRRSTIDLNI